MIIWINGCYGVGKTETANRLHQKMKDSHIYDPEQLGYFLWHSFPASMKRRGDFQDIEIWREFNYKLIEYMYSHFDGHLIIPMTLVNMDYYRQTAGRLKEENKEIRHFVLTASKGTILKRLKQRGEEKGCWAEQQIDRCLQAFEQYIPGEKIDTNKLSPDEAADIILTKTFLTEQ